MCGPRFRGRPRATKVSARRPAGLKIAGWQPQVADGRRSGATRAGFVTSRLELCVLGEFKVFRDGAPLALPPSRKTRALLAYLAVVARPQRRERLCEMFWQIPDDPRGALRWSLSRIRQVVDV